MQISFYPRSLDLNDPEIFDFAYKIWDSGIIF